MHAPFPSFLHQPGALQRQLHPRVTQLEIVFFHQLLVKVPHVEVKVLLLVQTQYFLHSLKRHPLR